MKKWYPEFANAIQDERFEKDENEDLEVCSEVSLDEKIIFKIKKGERILYLDGKRNAERSADLCIKRFGKIHKHAPIFLLGVASGLYLKKLIEKTDKSVLVIIYEPSLKIFLKLIKEVDLSEEIRNRPIGFIVKGINESEFDPVLRRVLSIETLEFFRFSIHPNYAELFPEEILEKTKAIEKTAMMIRVNYNSGFLFSQHLVKNQFQNMKYVCQGFHTRALVDVVPRIGPAIMVAAGPSLDKNIEELKKAKNRAFILAVDTAVRPLLNHGIVPDAFVTIDPEKPLELLQIDAAKDIPVIAPPTANSDILDEQRGKKIFFSDRRILSIKAYEKAGHEMPTVETGGSVACNCLSLLYKVGFDTIILVGQDLAYTDNKPHANGTFKEVIEQEDTAGMLRVKGNYEDTVPTITNLKLYLEWFEEYIAAIKEHRNVRIINATAGGAYIEGTELMSLKDAIEETCKEEINFEECIASMQTAFTDEERAGMVTYLHSIPHKLEELNRNAKKLYKDYHKINCMCKSGKNSKDAYAFLLKRIRKVAKKCEKNECYQLIMDTMSLAEYIVKSESLYQLDTLEEEMLAVSGQGMKYAKLLQECCALFIDLAKETLLTIE